MAHRDDYELTDYIFKVLLVGDKSVGKSSVVRRYVTNMFESWPTTICVDYYSVNKDIDGKVVKLQIWDTAGEEKYHCLTDMYYRNAHGVIYVFDLTNAESLQHVTSTWIKQVYTRAPDDCSAVLIGNKSDVRSAVPAEDIEHTCNLYCMSYFSTSALLDSNIDKVFEHLARKMVAQHSDYEAIAPQPDSLPSFALHSFQPHSPVAGGEELGAGYCAPCASY